MSETARNLITEHAETPVEATERRRELLTAYLKQLRKDRRKREDTGIKPALGNVDTWRDAYKHVYAVHGPGAGNGPSPETFADDLRAGYQPDGVGGGEQGRNAEPAHFNCTGRELKQAVTEERTGKATDADDFSGSMLKYLSDKEYDMLAEVVNNELNQHGELSSNWNEVIFTMIPKPGSTYPDTHVKAWRNIAGYSGMTKLVERVAVNRLKAEMEEAGWKLDSALMGGIPGKGVDDAAHNLGVLLV